MKDWATSGGEVVQRYPSLHQGSVRANNPRGHVMLIGNPLYLGLGTVFGMILFAEAQ